MTAKMEEGFRCEKAARQQTRDEIKKVAKKDLGAFKEETKKGCRGKVEVPCAVKRALEWVWEAQAPSPGLRLLPPGSMTYSSQERWTLKDGSHTTNNVFTRDSLGPR